MESRCYQGGDHRTRYRVYHFELRDRIGWLAMTIVVGMIVLMPALFPV